MELFARDLQAYLDGRVVRAYRASRLTAAGKWIARNKAASIALAATAFLFVELYRAGSARAEMKTLEQDNSKIQASWDACREQLESATSRLRDAQRRIKDLRKR